MSTCFFPLFYYYPFCFSIFVFVPFFFTFWNLFDLLCPMGSRSSSSFFFLTHFVIIRVSLWVLHVHPQIYIIGFKISGLKNGSRLPQPPPYVYIYIYINECHPVENDVRVEPKQLIENDNIVTFFFLIYITEESDIITFDLNFVIILKEPKKKKYIYIYKYFLGPKNQKP